MPDGAISFPILGDGYINPAKFITLGPLKIHWYGIIIGTGLILAMIYACKRANQFGLNSDHIFDIVTFGLPSAVICARIYYVVFYWDLYKDNFWDVFKIWQGGLGMYGVIFGAAMTVVIYTRVKKIPIGAFLDIASLGFLIGQSLGRWGNFMNREAYGYITDLPWKMGLTMNGVTTYVHPTFLYESLWNCIGFIILHFYSKKHRRYDGQIALMYAGWYGLGRMFIEGLRTDSLMLFNTGIRVSQLVAAVSFVVALTVLLINKYKRKPDPANMYVNRLKAEAEAAAAAEKEAAETENVDDSDETQSDETINDDN